MSYYAFAEMGHNMSVIQRMNARKALGPALWAAADQGNAARVAKLLRRPGLHVNWQDAEWENTPLFRACLHGHAEVAALLLADPRTEENRPNRLGETPFFVVCECGHLPLVRMLIGHDRVDINRPDADGATPLWIAANEGHLDVIKVLLVSGREVNVRAKTLVGPTSWSHKTAEERARQVLHPNIAFLLRRYERSPRETVSRLRVELGFADDCAAQTFALVLFLCDGFLRLTPVTLAAPLKFESDDDGDCQALTRAALPDNARQARFFRIVQRLPMELQMVLCHRLYLQPKDYVTVEKTEQGLVAIAGAFHKTDAGGGSNANQRVPQRVYY